MKRIAILTSGGDAPGMNACIRAATRYALSKGFDVYGVERGYQGLIEGELFRMGSRNVSGIIHKGGTFLKTARCPEFKTLDGQRHAAETLGAFGIDGLICIGGDGTFRGAKDLSDNFGVNVIGIPGTIDNDLAYTDYTLGFDTAVNTCIWAINCLRDTMGSHDRVSLLEVMGRRCGDIALYAGIAGGAEYILVPEVPYDLDAICKSISMSQKRGKTSNMIILAEGAGNQADVCKYILEKTGIEVKTTTLGHIQRGGSPTVQDRVLATRMGHYAVKELLMKGIGNRVVASQNGKVVDFDIFEALNMTKHIDEDLYNIAMEVSI